MKPAKLTPKFKPDTKILKNYDLQSDYNSDDLKYKIEGAFDQFDDILEAMGDVAEREMFHDYPEIKAVYNELYKFKVSPPSKELTQVLHKLTRSFNLKGRKLEIFPDNDKIHLDFKQIDKELEASKNLTLKNEKKLSTPKLTPFDNLEKEQEKKKKKKELENEEEMKKKAKHPFMIGKPTYRP